MLIELPKLTALLASATLAMIACVSVEPSDEGEPAPEPSVLAENSYTGSLGLRFVREDSAMPWRIDRVVGTAVTPIEPGDELLGINGLSIDLSTSVEELAALRAVDLLVKKPGGQLLFVTEAAGNKVTGEARQALKAPGGPSAGNQCAACLTSTTCGTVYAGALSCTVVGGSCTVSGQCAGSSN